MHLGRWYIIFILLLTSFTTDFQKMPEVGETAPDFSIRSVSGDTLKLSSYLGNYIFLDFWASWCAPCRTKHQKLIEVYDSLKGKIMNDSSQFIIISISLDNDSLMWVNGIKREKLVWPDHGCDLQRWKSPVVKKYGVSYLPYNFLIDPDGKITDKGMSAEEIEKVCLALLK